MGCWSSQDIHYCPVCEKNTDMITYNDNDDTGTHTNCCDCENEMPIPEVKLDKPFFIGGIVYTIHQGNDDEWDLEKYHAR